nr:reverse transcriptase domain-containing protein [Tanacetum cinerariifolium]GFA10418.1 reverse transcriptase domain-containing protein [Tanacetum cinerariifolium]
AMTDNRTMAEMLRAPTEGCAEAIGQPAGGSKKKPLRSITTWDDLVSKSINKFFPPSRTTNLRNEISKFHQKFDESFHVAWERYKDLLRTCPRHGFTELHQLDTFSNALNPADQDSLNAAAGGNLLEKSPQDALTINENKSKVHNSRSKPIASLVNAYDNHSSSEIAKLTHAVNQQTSAMTTAMTAMLKQFQSNPPPAQVKAVEEIYVTCGGVYPYYQCLTAGGNTFPEFRDNIQGYVSAATGNYNQGNLGYRPQSVSNQMRPPGSGTLPANTVSNPKGELKAITTRSGLVTDGPTVANPPKSVNPEEDECVEETDPRVLLILGRPFLRTARALIDVHASYSNHPHQESANLINIFNISSEDCLEVLVSNKQSGNPTFSLHIEIASLEAIHEIHDSKVYTFLSEELPDIDSFCNAPLRKEDVTS